MNRWFPPEFETDLISSARHYEKQRVGLGGEFLTVAEAAVEAIMAALLRWPERTEAFVVFIWSGFHS